MLLRLYLLISLLIADYFGNTQSTLRFQFKRISTDQGLSSTFVRKIVQDPFGFIWAGTQDGLNRFDGRRIKIYTKNNTKRYSLAGADVRDLLIDSSRHTLWVTTSYGGINGIDYHTGEVWFTWDQQADSQWKHTLFNSLLLAGQDLLIGSSSGLLRLDLAQKKIAKMSLPFFPKNLVLAVDRLIPGGEETCWAITRDHGVFLFSLTGMSLLARSRQETYTPARRCYDAAVLNRHEILLATNHGLQKARRHGGEIIIDTLPFPFLPPSLRKENFACHAEKEGGIVVSNAQRLIRIRPETNRYEVLLENSSFDPDNWLSSVFAIYTDRQGMLWLGCQQGLAYAENKPSPFFRVYQSAYSTTRIKHAYFLYPVSDTVLYACAQNGVYKINQASGDIVALQEGVPFYHAFRHPAGSFVFSSRDGSVVLTGGRMEPLHSRFPELTPFGKLVFNSHVKLDDSVLLLGTENFRGLLVWDFKNKKALLIDEKRQGVHLQENVINGLYLDKRGNTWVLGDRSITILNNKRSAARFITPFDPTTKKHYSIFFDVAQVGTNFYLASYGNGILVLDNHYRFVKELTAPKTLPANSTYKTLSFRDSLLFITTNNGISIITLNSRETAKFYDKSDGLHGNTFEENSGTVYNGKIYAGGEKGLTIITPQLLQNDRTPPLVYLDDITLQSTDSVQNFRDLTARRFTIPNNTIQTTLSFCAILYGQVAKITYAYKIDELHQNWIELGTQTMLPLIGLHPGTYHLQIKARNGYGVETAIPLHIELIFLPKWYQTWWFKTTILVLVCTLFYFFFRYRIAQIRKQEAIRKNIASDLHDDIGSTLNSVKIFAHLARTDSNGGQYLSQIEDSLQHTSMRLRDIIWVLEDSADTAQELMERIKKFALPLCAAQDITPVFHLDVNAQQATLSKEEKRNLLLIAKESINNAVKYADCTSIEVEFIAQKGCRKLTIRDNGKGFRADLEHGGNGIKNMQYRAKQLSYRLQLVSFEKGTVVSICKDKS